MDAQKPRVLILLVLQIGAAAVELATSVAAFWPETGKKFRSTTTTDQSQSKGATREALKQRVTWVSAIFLLIYVGIEVALGGWIVTYLIRVRNGDPFAAGLSATGYVHRNRNLSSMKRS
jgi:fucose permease